MTQRTEAFEIALNDENFNRVIGKRLSEHFAGVGSNVLKENKPVADRIIKGLLRGDILATVVTDKGQDHTMVKNPPKTLACLCGLEVSQSPEPAPEA